MRGSLERVLARWGYLAVGLGTFVGGETVLLTAGALAHKGVMRHAGVFVAAVCGSFAFTQACYQLGAWGSDRFIRRRLAAVEALVTKLRRWQARYRWLLVVAFRFVAGTSTLFPMLLGASRYPRGAFVALDLCGAVLWSAVFGGLGSLALASIRSASAREIDARHIVTYGLASVVGVAVGSALWRHLRRLRQRGARPRATPRGSDAAPRRDEGLASATRCGAAGEANLALDRDSEPKR